MSNETLQNIAVAVLVLGAAVFLVWKRVHRKARPSPLCGDCPACATAEKQKSDWGLIGGLRAPRPKPGAATRRG
ncbi:MAG: FeoB-associated Cys-rich membrane protein [Candidatus Eisenbacteria bacterium]|nr:FeoB-associated Cys-rich membrane protein [Candidatus Eisenbacteria bacterium]